MSSNLTRFTENNWDTYAGAFSFSDDSKPFIGANVMLEVVADMNGLCVMPFFDEEVCLQGGFCLVIQSCSEEIAKMLAERVLEDTSSMYPAEIKRYFKENGFRC